MSGRRLDHFEIFDIFPSSVELKGVNIEVL